MSKAMQQSRFKTTFYIDEENKKRMDSFVSSRKKTEFMIFGNFVEFAATREKATEYVTPEVLEV